MKKLFSILLLSCMCCIVFTACDFGESESEHTHNYRTEWSYDDTCHWHDCEDENCFEISEESEHTFIDGSCIVCGVEQYTQQEHTHVYASEWSHDYSEHWHACTYEDCYDISDIAEHTFENGFCRVCGQEYITMDLNYVIWNDECYVKGIGSCTNSNVVIPSEFNGYPVTEIEISDCDTMTSITIPAGALYFKFSDCTELTHVTFADGIQSLFGRFDRCTKLTSVTIPDSVTSIRDHTFSFCTALENVTIPDSVTSIEECAFEYCYSLTRISLSDNVTSLGKEAFYGCSGLKEVVIGKGIATLGASTFGSCTSLTDVTLPDGMTSIGGAAFADCTSLSHITIPDNVTSIEGSAFYECSSLTSIEIPDSVTSIGSNAFAECSSLTSIVVPDNVTSIGSYAFSYCASLTNATISSGVIYEGAFDNCLKLTSITFGDGVQSIGYNAFRACNSLSDVYVTNAEAWLKIRFAENGWKPHDYYNTLHIVDDDGNEVTEVEIPNTIAEINEHAFYNCKNLKSVTLPNSVTEIGDYAFEGCSSLTSVTIPDSVTRVGYCAFDDCDNLQYNVNSGLNYLGNERKPYLCLMGAETTDITTATIVETCKTIHSYAFQYCRSLTSVTVPENVVDIGEYAFEGCSNLTSINVGKDNTNYSSIDGILYDKSQTKIIHVPKKINGSVVIPDGVTKIEAYAFNYCYSLTSITIPDSVTSIGNEAFRSSSLTSINVDEDNANYSSVDGILYNKGQTEIIHVPDEIKGSVAIPDGVTNIGANAFNGRRNLTNITIPNSVTNIETYAFANCSNLTNIYYTGTEGDWNKISIDDENFSLTKATKYYYSESRPTYDGNYWHYDTDGVTPIKWDIE